MGLCQGDPMSLRKKSPKVFRNPFFDNIYITCTAAKSSQKILGYFCYFQKSPQSKQSLDGQKFAQSGHPGPLQSFIPKQAK
jgi:hypothetical protein